MSTTLAGIGWNDRQQNDSRRSKQSEQRRTGGPMNLGPDFKEFVECCERHDVRYLIVGGYAVGFHGHVRYTKDLDVWVEATPENASRILGALDDFGFGSVGLTLDDFLVPGSVIQLGYPPNRLDLITQPDGVAFVECWDARSTVVLDGVELNVIGLEDLIANKRASGRPRDLADIDDLGAS